MSLKPSKSKCLVLLDGKVQNDSFLIITTHNKVETIPSIVNNPVRFLGRSISFDIKDKEQVKAFSLAVTKALALIDKSYHRGIHKFWILQYLLLP